jgi:two-component system chemotaxis response regulator CheY
LRKVQTIIGSLGSSGVSRINPIFKHRDASSTPSRKDFTCRRPPASIFQAGDYRATYLARARSSVMALNPSISVLVVDDARTMTRIIRNLLQRIGFKDVDEAPGGAAALARMKLKRYGLFISDWNMEPMSGIDLLRQIRADPSLGDIPFIMVTAESRREHVIEAKEAGANNYIVKPFNAQALKAKIEAVFGEKAERVLLPGC